MATQPNLASQIPQPTVSPSVRPIEKAVELIKKAVEADNAQNYEEALQLYEHAMDYSIHIFQYGKFSDRAKEAMKNKFLLYLERAKMIKMFLAKRKNKMHLPAGQKAKEKKMSSYLLGGTSFRSQLSSVVKRRREEGGSDEEGEEEDKSEPVFERKFFWTCHKDTGFPYRVTHAVAGHRDADGEWYTYSFGGYHPDDERTVLEVDSYSGGLFFKSTPIDVHKFEMESQTCVNLAPPPDEMYFNIEPHCRTSIPGSRYGHTVCSYRDKVYMYGGRNDEDGCFSKVDCYDIRNNIWIKVKALGDTPSSRKQHACTMLGEEMIIHGGFYADNSKFSSDILAFNMETFIWRKLPSTGFRVPERDCHTATTVNRKLLVFGGRSDIFAPYDTANNVYDEVFYVYDYDTTKWKKQDVSGYGVKGRRSHTAACIGSSVIYFGGYNATTKEHFGDVFIVNTDTWLVTEVRPFGDAPCPRRGSGCALVGSDLFICGGSSPVEHEETRGEQQKEILNIHNDVYILHLLPSLEQLCMMVLIKEKIDLKSLPVHLQKKMCQLSQNSWDSRGFGGSVPGPA